MGRAADSRRMRTRLALLLALSALAPATARPSEPPEPLIVAMAQHLVQDHFMRGDGKGHYHLEFDTADLHPQPEPDYWAVVGGYVTDQNKFNTYVAALRLVCDDFDKVECWSLDKLAINGKILINRKPI